MSRSQRESETLEKGGSLAGSESGARDVIVQALTALLHMENIEWHAPTSRTLAQEAGASTICIGANIND